MYLGTPPPPATPFRLWLPPPQLAFASGFDNRPPPPRVISPRVLRPATGGGAGCTPQGHRRVAAPLKEVAPPLPAFSMQFYRGG